MIVSISSQGKDDFIDETEDTDEFSPDDWIEAFEWITIALKCCECEHEDNSWIDYETM